jgi:hypothetical protein
LKFLSIFRKSNMFKSTTVSQAVALLAVVTACGLSQAESTSGYSAAGTGTVTATARVNLSVTVPKLILLRVGAAGGTPTNLAWTAVPTIPAGAATPLTGSNQAATWDGTAPVFGGVTNPGAVAAFAWTNSSGGGSLACATTSLTGGLAAADFAVASGAGLAHPGTTAACATPTTFARNAVQSGSWTYSILPATLNGLAAGAYSGLITYTATSL